ncbi:hypothetical protein Tco_1103496 [Tanacetum coccineum]
MVEEVTSLKNDFKQKENKYLKEFFDMKALKEKVAIGYKNPLCLNHAKQVQPALYNGHEIVKTNHVSAIVHNSEETLEIAEITRKKMNEKMKDPECVKKKVKIVPHDYSKEDYLATFTPQKQLTPEQIFWSNDLIKMKAKTLKEHTTTSRTIKALTVYPPNTPATLVPKYDDDMYEGQDIPTIFNLYAIIGYQGTRSNEEMDYLLILYRVDGGDFVKNHGATGVYSGSSERVGNCKSMSSTADKATTASLMIDAFDSDVMSTNCTDNVYGNLSSADPISGKFVRLLFRHSTYVQEHDPSQAQFVNIKKHTDEQKTE